jgi:hypothetical protein
MINVDELSEKDCKSYLKGLLAENDKLREHCDRFIKLNQELSDKLGECQEIIKCYSVGDVKAARRLMMKSFIFKEPQNAT